MGAFTDCRFGIGLAIVSVPYYRYIYKYGLDKFVRFAKKVWKIHGKDMSKDEITLPAIRKTF